MLHEANERRFFKITAELPNLSWIRRGIWRTLRMNDKLQPQPIRGALGESLGLVVIALPHPEARRNLSSPPRENGGARRLAANRRRTYAGV
jgi:hypothetical protein